MTGDGVRFRIDRDRCNGHGRCYTLFPAEFTSDDAGYGQVTGGGAGLADAERAGVLAACPEEAIVTTSRSEVESG